jgi:acetyltransferase-like isoleucine patch superfamily enzyme
MRRIIFICGRLLSRFYTYRFSRIFEVIKVYFYSGWISYQFGSFGKHSVVKHLVYLRGGKYITIGNNVFIGTGGVITAWDSYSNDKFNPQIDIGNNVCIGEHCHITAINKIIIGNNVLTGMHVTITDNAHGENSDTHLPPRLRPLNSYGDISIGDNVWIGDKVTILPNVHIGRNVIIGANAVVTKDIPDNCVAVGIPAKIIKSDA